MKLDLLQRQMLLNQYEILAAVKKDSGEAKGYERAITILRAGYEREYESLLGGLDQDGFTQGECEEVWDVFRMFDMLKQANAEKVTGVDPRQVQFAGFSHNEEAGHNNYAHFMVGDDNFRWFAPLPRCPAAMMPRYRRALAVWRGRSNRDNLSEQDVRNIAAANPID